MSSSEDEEGLAQRVRRNLRRLFDFFPQAPESDSEPDEGSTIEEVNLDFEHRERENQDDSDEEVDPTVTTDDDGEVDANEPNGDSDSGGEVPDERIDDPNSDGEVEVPDERIDDPDSEGEVPDESLDDSDGDDNVHESSSDVEMPEEAGPGGEVRGGQAGTEEDRLIQMEEDQNRELEAADDDDSVDELVGQGENRHRQSTIPLEFYTPRVVYSTNTVDVEVERVQHGRSDKFKLEDFLYKVSLEPINNQHVLIIDNMNCVAQGKKLKCFYFILKCSEM